MEIEEAKRRARSGPLLLLAKRAFAVGVTFLSTITVARLVSPAEYGLASMALIVLSFAQIFRDFGLTNAVLRKGIISNEEMSFIFWFNAAMTTAIAVVIAAMSPLIADFYGEPTVAWVVLASLVGFVLSGFSGQHRALIARELRFGAIAVIDSLSLTAGFITTVGLAALYHNVWAIVAGTVAQALVGSVSSVIASGWRPGRPRRIKELGELLKFGANSSIFTISVFVSNNAAPVLIGHFLGAGQLGQYNRAESLFRLPITNLVQPITQATMPLLTRLREAPEEYRVAYISLVRKLCVVLFPASVILTFSSVPLTIALLGDRWGLAGQILAALAPTLVAVAIASAASDLFITQDRSSELRSLGLFETVLRVGAILLAVRLGVVATALAFTISTIGVVVLRVAIVGRKGPVTIRDQLRACLPSVPIATGSAGACAAAQALIIYNLNGAAASAAILIVSGTAGGLLIAICVKSSRAALFEVLDTFGLQKLVSSRRLSR